MNAAVLVTIKKNIIVRAGFPRPPTSLREIDFAQAVCLAKELPKIRMQPHVDTATT
jgi:hypothetical protein